MSDGGRTSYGGYPCSVRVASSRRAGGLQPPRRPRRLKPALYAHRSAGALAPASTAFGFEVVLQRLAHDLATSLFLNLRTLVLLPGQIPKFILELQVAFETGR